MLRVTGLAVAALLAACATSEQDPPATAHMPASGPPLEGALVNNAVADIGKAQFTPAPTGVLIRVLVNAGGLTPGWHGAHMQMTGDCSDTAKFEHAGDQIKKGGAFHGLLYPHGP